MAYDAATGTVVLFGGMNSSYTVLADTWTYNGTTWTQQSPATSPSARQFSTMAYDAATGTIVLFGGNNGNSNLADTWTYNGTTWTRQSPATSPPARQLSTMAYDVATGTVVLFGGYGSSGNLADTWTYNGTTWTQQSPATSPPARYGSTMAYDAATGTVVLFGGVNNSGTVLADMWTYNGTTWTQQTPATSPPAREYSTMAYDAATGTVVLFGGNNGNSNLADTWTYSAGAFTSPTTNVGTAAAQTPVYFNITATGTVGTPQVLTQGVAGLDFTLGSTPTTCTGSTLGVCTVYVAFTPQAAGQRLGAVNLTSPQGAVLATAYVSGTGTGPLATLTPGSISTVAGNGTTCASPTASPACGDGTAATASSLYYPAGVTVDGAGNLYIADQSTQRIRKVTAATGLISTVAGNGTGGYTASQDTGTTAATAASLFYPNGVVVDGAGNLYIADESNQRIRKVTAATGFISTVAGNGTTCATPTASPACGDGAAATAASLYNPTSVAVDGAGNLYIADDSDQRIRKVTAATGFISTVAGNGTQGYNASQDTGTTAATAASLQYPVGVTVDGAGNLYIVDYNNQRIRKVTAATGFISTVAGNGTGGYTASQDTGTTAATAASLDYPEGVAVDGAGNLYIADDDSNRIRKVTSATGFISTVAGNGAQGYTASQDTGTTAATAAQMNGPGGVAVDNAGNLYIADQFNNRIRKVTATAAPLVFASEQVNTTTDAAQVVILNNNGNQSLIFTTPSSGSNPSITGPYTLSSSAGSCSSLTSLASGATCTETISYAPVVVSTTNTGAVTNTDNSNNPSVTTASQVVSLSGASTGTATTTTLAINPSNNVGAGQTVTLTSTTTPTAATGNSVQFYDNGSGIGGANAYANGTSSYQDTNIAVGSHSFTAVFAGTGVYGQSTSPPVNLTVLQSQTITFPQPTTPAKADASATLTATASSGLAVTYSIASGPATISGSTVTYTGAGTVVIAANQAGNSTYAAASTVSDTVTTTASPATYTAPTEPVGTTSPTQTANITITTAGQQAYTDVMTTGQYNLDYKLVAGGTCSYNTTYTVGTVCTVLYTFTPRAPGQRLGAIQIQNMNNAVLGTSLLTGTGTGAAVAFPGNTATTTLGSGFSGPYGVAVDGAGNVYVADSHNNAVKEIVAVGGSIPASPTIRTLGSGFNYPSGVAVDGAGDVFVADSNNNAVKELVAVGGSIPTSSPTILTLGSGFSYPAGVAVDGAGNVYVADYYNNAVKELVAVGGSIPAISPTILTLGSGFNNPGGVVVDGAGDVFVADSNNNAVKEIVAVGGSIPASNPTIRTLGSGFSGPFGLAVDGAGNVYVADSANNAVKELVAVGGSIPASSPTILTLGSGFSYPPGVAVDGAGSVYVVDQGHSAVKEIPLTLAPALAFPGTAIGSTSAAQNTLVENIGNTALTIASIASSTTNFTFAGAVNGNTAACGTTLASSGLCNLAAMFAPQTAGALTANGVVTDNSLNVTGSTQTVALSGTGTQVAQTITFTQPTTPVLVGATATLSATSSSGLAVTFSIISGSATLSGTNNAQITYTGVGAVVIAANQAGNSTYAAASTVSDTVQVQTQSTITWNPSSHTGFNGVPVGAGVLDATSNTAGTFAYTATPAGGSAVAITSTSTLAVGTYMLTANFTPSSSNSTSATATIAFTVVHQEVFVTNSGGTVDPLYDNGTQIQGSTISGGGIGGAVDGSGYVWSINTNGSSVSKFTDAGVLSSSYTAGNISNAGALAIDGLGTVWIANGSSVTALTNAGAAAFANPVATAGNISSPTALQIDSSGSVWVANTGNGTVTEIIGAAAPVVTPTVTSVVNATPGTRP
jgi:DNA-binding beta-propeller fold protein YncE